MHPGEFVKGVEPDLEWQRPALVVMQGKADPLSRHRAMARASVSLHRPAAERANSKGLSSPGALEEALGTRPGVGPEQKSRCDRSGRQSVLASVR